MFRLVPAALVPVLLAGCSSPPPPDVAPWAAAFAKQGGPLPSVAVGPHGDVAVAGDFAGGVSFTGELPAGKSDALLAVLAPAGAFRFSFAPAGAKAMATGVTFVGDEVVVCGWFQGTLPTPHGPIQALSQDTFVASFDLSGKNLWTRHFSADLGGPSGAGTSAPLAVARTPDGGLVLAGQFTGTIGFGGPPLEAQSTQPVSFVAGLDAAGLFLWQVGFGGSGNTAARLAIDPGGGVVVGGTIQGDLVFGGHEISAALPSSQPAGYVAALTPDGAPRWVVGLGGMPVPLVGVDGVGNVYVAGNAFDDVSVVTGGDVSTPATGPLTPFSLSFTRDGDLRHETKIHHQSESSFQDEMELAALASTHGGHMLVTGMYWGSPQLGAVSLPSGPGQKVFLAELDHQGTALAHAFGDAPPGGVGTGLALPEDASAVLLTGNLDGTAQLGTGVVGFAGVNTIFVARLAPLVPAN
jgi:hypothetical protein